MPIDFQAAAHLHAYDGRAVDPAWAVAMTQLVTPSGKRVLDIGCGGGLYTRAWAELGAGRVSGVDFSATPLEAARATCQDLPNVTFHLGDALATGLPDASADVVFERAVAHHLTDLDAAASEASRLLAPEGHYIVQDRTGEDVRFPGSPEHIRGYFIERFPRLLEVEMRRRPTRQAMEEALRRAGFGAIQVRHLWETRRVYEGFDALAEDVRGRRGRSLLHELDDAEIEELIAYLAARLPSAGAIVERDRWTIWHATTPVRSRV